VRKGDPSPWLDGGGGQSEQGGHPRWGNGFKESLSKPAFPWSELMTGTEDRLVQPDFLSGTIV
jgi:hypothetical protein